MCLRAFECGFVRVCVAMCVCGYVGVRWRAPLIAHDLFLLLCNDQVGAGGVSAGGKTAVSASSSRSSCAAGAGATGAVGTAVPSSSKR